MDWDREEGEVIESEIDQMEDADPAAVAPAVEDRDSKQQSVEKYASADMAASEEVDEEEAASSQAQPADQDPQARLQDEADALTMNVNVAERDSATESPGTMKRTQTDASSNSALPMLGRGRSKWHDSDSDDDGARKEKEELPKQQRPGKRRKKEDALGSEVPSSSSSSSSSSTSSSLSSSSSTSFATTPSSLQTGDGPAAAAASSSSLSRERSSHSPGAATVIVDVGGAKERKLESSSVAADGKGIASSSTSAPSVNNNHDDNSSASTTAARMPHAVSTSSSSAAALAGSLFRTHPLLVGCRSVDKFKKLNRIEEGAYGIVYRAQDVDTGEIVALKKLKMEKEKEGFPITSLREINTLLLAKHENIVDVREIVFGKELTSIYIVMEYVEHDLKGLMEGMKTGFVQSEVKTMMLQLLSAVALLHDNWIIHRDLKTSNLLMSNRGQIKVGDFGYRAPELLLGETEYTTAIDVWSIGCIFAELINREPLFPGRGEIDQIDRIFKTLGTPNEKIWPGYSKLPNVQKMGFTGQPYGNLRAKVPYLTESGYDLLTKLLTYCPKKRISAEEALKHPYFSEAPLPKDPAMFPTWPSKSAGERRRKDASPSAPMHHNHTDEEDLYAAMGILQAPGEFRLRLG